MKTTGDLFLKEITRRIPQEAETVDLIAEILSSDKDSVRGKLKGEVPFTFEEAMIISRQLNISLDSLDLDILPDPELSARLNPIEYVNPSKTDFALQEEIVSILKLLKDIPNAEGGEITNILPQPIYIAYENISRFYLFKWKYRSKKFNNPIPYKDIVITPKLKKIQKENVKWAKTIHTDYVLDHLIFRYLVNDIKYFYHIRLISKEEVELIKEDLFKILDQIAVWTQSGFFEETGKRIYIYISDVNIDTSYAYLGAPGYQLTIAKAFLLNGIASSEKITFEELKHWIESIKLQSILISGCNERERIKFLKEQHSIIESISQL